MNFIKLYTRVLSMLGPEARLGWVLAGANVALAAAQFAEPVLFGRIIDSLVRAQAASTAPSFNELTPLLGAWVGFGLFIIAWVVGLNAEKRRRDQGLRPEGRVSLGKLLGQWATLLLVSEMTVALVGIAALRLSGKFPVSFWTGIF